jgi:hypothetical protein
MYNLFDLKLFWGAKEYGSVCPDDVNATDLQCFFSRSTAESWVFWMFFNVPA